MQSLKNHVEKTTSFSYYKQGPPLEEGVMATCKYDGHEFHYCKSGFQPTFSDFKMKRMKEEAWGSISEHINRYIEDPTIMDPQPFVDGRPILAERLGKLMQDNIDKAILDAFGINVP